MLEEGHTREEAQFEIDTLPALVGLLGDASLDLSARGDTLELATTIQLAPPSARKRSR